VERHCDALKDFTGEKPAPLAMDIGCAVGGSTFHLSKCGFGAVLGIDYSHAFINAANVLKRDGMITYRTVVEGKITVCLAVYVSLTACLRPSRHTKQASRFEPRVVALCPVTSLAAALTGNATWPRSTATQLQE
jgi:trans-aconitate methyltransferase